MSPTITIITVCKNAESYIEETIKSVISQTYLEKEYIVIDGASTDGTLDIISRYAEYIDCIVSEPDYGISDAFNKAIAIAHGKLIGIMNAGDVFCDNNVLLSIAKIYDSEEEIIQGKQIVRNYDTGYEYILAPSVKYGHIWSLLRFYPNHMATYIPRKQYEQFGGYDLGFKICMDIELLYRMHRNGVNVKITDQMIGIYRLGGVSDKEDWKEAKEKIEILKRDNGNRTEILFCRFVLFIKNLMKLVAIHTCGMDALRKKWYKDV